MDNTLEIMLAWLGLSQYYERLIHAGFESWETLLGITEADLEVLDIEIGHRRKLQREIKKTSTLANMPGTPQLRVDPYKTYDERQMASYLRFGNSDAPLAEPDIMSMEVDVTSKRGYRHHPKLDSNAPKRPYSAYMLFSNHHRDLLSSEKLEFPEISRRVGRRWQALVEEEKDIWRQQAQPLWDHYKFEMMQYQDTEDALEHKRYLEEFHMDQASKLGERSQREVGNQKVFKRPITIPGSGRSANAYPTLGQRPVSMVGAPTYSMSPIMSPAMPFSGPQLREISIKPESEVPFAMNVEPTGENAKDIKAKSKQACEPCRRRKSRCDEERPTCGHCLAQNAECYYSGVKVHIDKSKFQDMLQKLETCEQILVRVKPQLAEHDQTLIQTTLNSEPPHITTKQPLYQARFRANSHANVPANANSSTDDSPSALNSDTESYLDGPLFNEKRTDPLPRIFEGRGSDAQWMRTLVNELNHEGSGRHANQLEFFPDARLNVIVEDKESALIGNNVDPFQVPVEATADALVNAYFSTVHVSFPILQLPLFMHQYHKSKTVWHKLFEFGDHTFLTTLQTVLAIGAVYARLSHSGMATNDRDHLLYFARARLLASDGGILNEDVHLGQAQVFGLSAMYCLVTNQMNRAWFASGLAIRAAQSLGLHLPSVFSSTPSTIQEYWLRVWSALVTFEQTLATIVGRPTMVPDQDSGVGPWAVDTSSFSSSKESAQQRKIPTKKKKGSVVSKGSKRSISEASYGSSASSSVRFVQSQTLVEAKYFKHHVDLAAQLHSSLSQLYELEGQNQWSAETHALVDRLDDRLSAWKRMLDEPFNNPTSDFFLESSRTPLASALAIQFHCARMMVNLPSLCSQERTASHEPPVAAVSRCISSAREVIDLITHEPFSAMLCHCSQWWLLLPHLKRALTVLLLELAFRAEHMRTEAKLLLAVSLKGVEWLRDMARTNNFAERLWVTMDALLVKAGRRIGVDMGANRAPKAVPHPPNSWPQAVAVESASTYPRDMPVNLSNHSLSPAVSTFDEAIAPSPFKPCAPSLDHTFPPPQGQATYLNPVGPETFDTLFLNQTLPPQSVPPLAEAPSQPAPYAAQMQALYAPPVVPGGYPVFPGPLHHPPLQQQQQPHRIDTGVETAGVYGSEAQFPQLRRFPRWAGGESQAASVSVLPSDMMECM